MGFFSNFFGGKKSETVPIRLDVYSPEQQQLLQGLARQAKTGMQGPAPRSPDAFVPTTQSEQNYIDWARTDALKYARGETPYAVGDQYVNQFMQAYRPVWERARNEAMDLARAEYAGPSYWGSARAKGLTDVASDWGEKLALQEAQLRLQQDQARREAIDKYIGVGTSGMQTGGAMERGIAQEKVMSDLNRFLRGEEVGGSYDPIYNQNTQLALALLGVSPYQYGTKTETKGPGLGYSFLSGIAPGIFGK